MEIKKGKVGNKEFTVKSGMAGFSRRKFVGEKSKVLPFLM
jgi:hypothetical protein